MMKIYGMGLLICKCKREILITDGNMTRVTLTLAPMGMVLLGGAKNTVDQVALSIGNGKNTEH